MYIYISNMLEAGIKQLYKRIIKVINWFLKVCRSNIHEKIIIMLLILKLKDYFMQGLRMLPHVIFAVPYLTTSKILIRFLISISNSMQSGLRKTCLKRLARKIFNKNWHALFFSLTYICNMITGYIAYFSKCHAIAYVTNTQLISLRPMKLYPIVLFSWWLFFSTTNTLGIALFFFNKSHCYSHDK